MSLRADFVGVAIRFLVQCINYYSAMMPSNDKYALYNKQKKSPEGLFFIVC